MTIRPRNWKSFQHYTDRRPAWVKLHRDLLDNFEFHRLPVASRALAPLLWLLASESEDACIDGDYEKLAFRLRSTAADIETALKPLIESAFFEVVERDASTSLATRKQNGVSEREEETEEETEGEKTRARDPVSRGARDAGDALTRTPSAETVLAEMNDSWKRDIDGVNVVELQRFFDFADKHPHKPKPYSPSARIALAKKLAGMGDAEHQRQVVEQSMSADHVVLYALKDRPSKHATDSAKLTQATQRKLAEFKARAEKVGFRQPLENEDVLGYGTLVERAENAARSVPRKNGPQPIAKLLGEQPA